MEQLLEKLCGLYCLSSECVPYTVYRTIFVHHTRGNVLLPRTAAAALAG